MGLAEQKEALAEYDRAGLGICRRTYEPVTSRTTEFYCNPAHAAMTNLPVRLPPPPARLAVPAPSRKLRLVQAKRPFPPARVPFTLGAGAASR
jgi:hypothetical protein